MGEDIEGAMQQAPQSGRQFMILYSAIQQSNLTTDYPNLHGYRKIPGDNPDKTNSPVG